VLGVFATVRVGWAGWDGARFVPAARAALRSLRGVLRAPMTLSRVGSGVGGVRMSLLRVSGAEMLLACSGADAVAFDISV